MAHLTNTHKLHLPHLQSENIAGEFAYTQLYRHTGMRIEYENVNDKNIFHNYGQGGSEISLSFGSAYIAVKSMNVKVDHHLIGEIAVLGSGPNAFITALEAIKRGYKVTLYAEKLPGEKDYPHYDQAFWYPGFYDISDPLRHELLSKLSHEFFTESLNLKRYQSLQEVNCFMKGPKADEIREVITDFVIKDISPVYADFGNEQMEEFIGFKSISIDTNLFLEEILTELKLRNMTIVKKKFSHIEDVLALKEKEIMNCLSENCGAVFGDDKVRVVKCQFVEVRNKEKLKKEESFCIWNTISHEEVEKGQMEVMIKGKGELLTVGPLWQIEGPEPDYSSMASSAYHFIKRRITKASKL